MNFPPPPEVQAAIHQLGLLPLLETFAIIVIAWVTMGTVLLWWKLKQTAMTFRQLHAHLKPLPKLESGSYRDDTTEPLWK